MDYVVPWVRFQPPGTLREPGLDLLVRAGILSLCIRPRDPRGATAGRETDGG